MATHPVKRAIVDALPICLGFFPVAGLFGLLFKQAGFNPLFAPLFSLLLHGASVQFLALSLLISHADCFYILFAALPLAVRNSFYGLSLHERYKFSPLVKNYLAFCLIDECYSLLTTKEPCTGKEDRLYCLTLSSSIHISWVVWTIVGCIAGNYLPTLKGLEFAQTALFLILAMEQYFKCRDFRPFIFAIAVFIPSYLLFPSHFLVAAIALYLLLISFVPQKQKVLSS